MATLLPDARFALGTVDAVSAVPGGSLDTPGGYAQTVITLLNSLVPPDAIAWLWSDLTNVDAVMTGFPGELDDDATCLMLLDLADDHPLMVRYLATARRGRLPAPRRLSDLVTDHEDDLLRHLEDAYRKLGCNNRISALTALRDRGEDPTDLATSPEVRARHP